MENRHFAEKSVAQYQNFLVVSMIVTMTAMIVGVQQFKAPTILTEISQALNMTDASAPWIMSIFTFVGSFLMGGLALVPIGLIGLARAMVATLK